MLPPLNCRVMLKMMNRKLSEIIIEIAMQGLLDEKYAHSKVMYALMFLAHVAWNRDTKSPDYLADAEYAEYLKQFPIPRDSIQKELISDNWEEILTQMTNYKKRNFPADKRIITLCGYTPWGTLRVEWE